MSEPSFDDLEELAIVAKEIAKDKGITIEDTLEIIQKATRNIPIHLQMLVDSLVLIQGKNPMSPAGWKAFVRDIQYTNEKHGLNLVIKPELLEGRTHLEIYEAFAKSIDKGIKELTESDRRQAIMNAVLEKGNDPTST